MRIIPKKTRYHYAFRNKLQTKRVAKLDARVNAFGQIQTKCNHIFQIKAWLQKYAPLLKSKSENSGDAKRLLFQPTARVVPRETTTHFVSYGGHQLLFGNFGIISETHGKLTAKFIKTIYLDIAKTLKKKSKVWLRLCCDTPVTARPVETRMGKGKGAISHWEAKIRPGQVLFEFSGLRLTSMHHILNDLQQKSGLRLRLVY